MDFVSVGVIVVAAWMALMVGVLAMCRAAARGDASARGIVQRGPQSTPYERAPRIERPALG